MTADYNLKECISIIMVGSFVTGRSTYTFYPVQSLGRVINIGPHCITPYTHAFRALSH